MRIDMRHYTDIVGFGRDGSLVLLVEVKAKREASRSWAAKLRRNMYAHGRLPAAPFFLLALPDRLYLWAGDGDGREAEPDYEVAPPPYSKQLRVSNGRIDETSLELVVVSWLDQLAGHYGQEESEPQRTQWMRTSGLLDAISEGRVEVQALV